MEMDDILETTLLYDCYSELLTANQRKIFEEVRFGDLSLGEAADAYGISRQAVHDQLRRIDRALAEYEEKLGLVARFRECGEILSAMKEDLSALTRRVSPDSSLKDLTDRLAAGLARLEELR